MDSWSKSRGGPSTRDPVDGGRRCCRADHGGGGLLRSATVVRQICLWDGPPDATRHRWCDRAVNMAHAYHRQKLHTSCLLAMSMSGRRPLSVPGCQLAWRDGGMHVLAGWPGRRVEDVLTLRRVLLGPPRGRPTELSRGGVKRHRPYEDVPGHSWVRTVAGALTPRLSSAVVAPLDKTSRRRQGVHTVVHNVRRQTTMGVVPDAIHTCGSQGVGS